MGLINKGGAWYTLDFVEDKPKFQGMEKVRNYLLEHQDSYDKLYVEVKNMMGIKC